MPLCQALNKTNAFNLFISPVQIAESELGTENYKNHETSRRLVNSSDSNITPRKNKTLVMTQPEEDTRSLPAVIIHSVILALSAILALMGNSLVCLAFYRNRRLRTVTNVYVLSLAVADIMASTFVLPFSTVASGYRAWPFYFAFCQFSGLAANFWGALSINIFALTAVNRYVCIVKPPLYPALFTKKKTLLTILLVLLLTITAHLTATFATPILFQWYPRELACDATGLEIRAVVSVSRVGFVGLTMSLIGSFSKPRRRRQRERHQAKDLMSRTMVLHVHFESWYISLPSSAKQQREMTKFHVFWRTRTTMANFSYRLLQLNAVGAYFPMQGFTPIGVLNSFTELRHSKVK